MEVGAARQSVTVAANAEAVETASSDVSNLRTRQQVVDLPLNNRNFTQLVQLAPGVDNHGGATNVTNGGYTEGRGTSGAVVNGNPSDIGIYLFDGILGIDADANVLIFYPPVDSIQEFKVQTYISTVPIAAFHTGDFSALLPKTVLRVPGTTVPLPNNQVQQINPTSAKLMALYPLPNIPGGGLVSNYLYNGALVNNIDQG